METENGKATQIESLLQTHFRAIKVHGYRGAATLYRKQERRRQ
jgi:hypothetical protein